jgi:hypothetical protein
MKAAATKKKIGTVTRFKGGMNTKNGPTVTMKTHVSTAATFQSQLGRSYVTLVSHASQ